jgi:quinoprotein glucose dehydrogenase
VTVMHEGQSVDAVAQTTKQGFIFVFDRVTGKPLFPIEEHAFPASTVPGEVTSKTQPIPLAPPPYARQTAYRGHANHAHSGGSQVGARAIQDLP